MLLELKILATLPWPTPSSHRGHPPPEGATEIALLQVGQPNTPQNPTALNILGTLTVLQHHQHLWEKEAAGEIEKSVQQLLIAR